MSAPPGGLPRNRAIDALKGIAIVAVLLLHAVPRQFLVDSFALFHIWQSVPVLLVLMGYTGVLTRVRPLQDYARRRASRLLIPLAIVWLVSVAIAAVKSELVWDPLLLVGRLPASGPGNYFIALALAFAAALPFLRKLLSISGVALVAFCFFVDLAYQLVGGWFSWEGYLHSATLLRVLFTISLGMLLASSHVTPRLIWILLPASLVYLAAMQRGYVIPFLVRAWQSQALFAAAYPAALVAIGLRFQIPAPVATIGRASYHIFLVQILWFGQIAPLTIQWLPVHLAVQVILNVAACLALGLLFWRVETWGVRSVSARLGPHPEPSARPMR